MEEALRIGTLVIFIVIFIVGLLGNAVVIYVTGFRMKKTVNSVWFLNLALADFLFVAFLVLQIISLSHHQQWPFGLILCKLNSFVTIVNMFASIFLLTAISVDRCLSVWLVVWAQNKRTIRKAQLISVLIWATAVICSIPYAAFRDLGMDEDETIYCIYSESMTHEQVTILYTFRFVVGFLIPFLVISVSYIALVVRAVRLQGKKKKKAHKIIASIILAFFICWLPFHIFNFLELKAISTENYDLFTVVKIGGSLSFCLAAANSCLNPILYVFMCDEFQRKLKHSICFVLESALAEDHQSSMSTRSLSSHFSQFHRNSDSSAPVGMRDAATPLT